MTKTKLIKNYVGLVKKRLTQKIAKVLHRFENELIQTVCLSTGIIIIFFYPKYLSNFGLIFLLLKPTLYIDV